ncbi:glycosyltransferase family 8 protein [Halomonas sp. GXIMD04776]|uniref:glycosyltransferase family 8 protein n=1 Tax=Halomonas sp. GXIMD04776 TaxID=3415605 RepID=UPI003C9CBFD2
MIDVVFCADETYARYGAVAMASAIANCSTPHQLHFHWLTTGLSNETHAGLYKLAEDAGARIDILELDETVSNGLELGRFGAASLLRLTMHHYLPKTIEKLVYLDCDVLVLGDLAELWSMPLDGCIAGAVMDLCNPRNLATRNGVEDYFNSGILLVDLDKWAIRNVDEQALTYINEKKDTLKLIDQDALNHVLAKDWKRLPMAWNFQPTAYAAQEKGYHHLQPYSSELKEAVERPKIVHFIGSTKPWHPGCTHPLQELFVSYSQRTPWPIDMKGLKKSLPLSQRIRMALRAPKLRRRRKLTLR